MWLLMLPNVSIKSWIVSKLFHFRVHSSSYVHHHNIPLFRRLSSLATSSGLLGVIARGPLGLRDGMPRAAFKFLFSGLGLVLLYWLG